MDALRKAAWLSVSFLFINGCASFGSGPLWGRTNDPPPDRNAQQTARPLPTEDFSTPAKSPQPAPAYAAALEWASNVPARGTAQPRRTVDSWATPERAAEPDYRARQWERPPAYEQDPYGYPAERPRQAERPRSRFGPLEQPAESAGEQTRLAGDTVEFDFSGGAAATAAAEPTMQAPSLGDVGVRPMSGGRVATRSPQATVNHGMRVEPGTLEDMVDRIAAESADASFREQFQRRVLHALAGNDDDARRPVQLYSAEKQELVASFIEMLIYLRDIPDGELTVSEGAARSAVDRVVRSVRQVSGVRIPKLVLCTRVSAFGQYAAIDPAEFPAGRPIEFVAYVEVADWVSERTPEGAYRSVFGLKVEVFDARGQRVHLDQADAVEDVCQTRRRDCFIAPLVRLPGGLPGGEYVVKVTLTDTIGKKFAQSRVSIRLVGRS